MLRIIYFLLPVSYYVFRITRFLLLVSYYLLDSYYLFRITWLLLLILFHITFFVLLDTYYLFHFTYAAVTECKCIPADTLGKIIVYCFRISCCKEDHNYLISLLRPFSLVVHWYAWLNDYSIPPMFLYYSSVCWWLFSIYTHTHTHIYIYIYIYIYKIIG